jgi:hypothetical protein
MVRIGFTATRVCPRLGIRRRHLRCATAIPRRLEPTALKLSEGALDFFGYLSLVVNEPLLVGVQHAQSALDDFIRALVGARLHHLGDQFFLLRPKGNGHRHLPVIVATSGCHGKTLDLPRYAEGRVRETDGLVFDPLDGQK